MINILIVDDEQYVRKDIEEKLLTNFSQQITILGEADSVKTGIEAIDILKPDLVLLDINLQDGTGFDIISDCVFKDFHLIFITGFDNHAITAIKVGALDYILKPVLESEFISAIEKILKTNKTITDLPKSVEVSKDYFQGSERKRIILKTAETIQAIYEDELIYCKSDGNYTTYFTKHNGSILISKPIKIAEEILTKEIFIRCHQSYIINKNMVVKYHRNGYLLFREDIKIPVSGRRKDYALNAIFE